MVVYGPWKLEKRNERKMGGWGFSHLSRVFRALAKNFTFWREFQNMIFELGLDQF
jgi:hypothetical protein